MCVDEDFERFVHARSASLARASYLLTGDVHRAEELLQESLARAAERWASITRGGADPEPGVRRILYTRSVDGWRKRRVVEVRRKRRVVEVWHPAPPEPGPWGDDEEQAVRRLVLRRALLQLTPRQRAVLVLRFFEDQTEVQTAATLDCSVSTVKSQTRHALARLRILAPDLLAAFEPEETS